MNEHELTGCVEEQVAVDDHSDRQQARGAPDTQPHEAPRRRRRRRSAEEWAHLIERQQRCGLSVTAFCRREDLSAVTFYQWRARLRQGDAKREAPPASGPQHAAFVRLQATDDDAAHAVARFPGGVELRVGGDLLPALVGALLDADGQHGADSSC